MASAQAIRSGVASADDHNVFASREYLGVRVQLVSQASAVLLRQELHCEMNAFELASWNPQVARLLASACENDCVELLAQFFEGHVVANVDVGLETNTFLEHLSEAAIKDVALKFEVRNAVPE